MKWTKRETTTLMLNINATNDELNYLLTRGMDAIKNKRSKIKKDINSYLFGTVSQKQLIKKYHVSSVTVSKCVSKTVNELNYTIPNNEPIEAMSRNEMDYGINNEWNEFKRQNQLL